MEFVGSPVVSAADGRRDEANGTAQQLLRSALSNAAQSSAADQPFISGKKSRFLLTTEAPCAFCALPASLPHCQPKTRNERGEQKFNGRNWSFQMGSTTTKLSFFRASVPTPFSLDWKGKSEEAVNAAEKEPQSEFKSACRQ